MNFIRANDFETVAAGGDDGPCPACRSHFLNLPETPAICQKIHLARGARLESRDRDGCLHFWVMLGGTAATCTVFADGRRQILKIEGAGDVICAKMAGNGTQNWLEALSECDICELDFSAAGPRLRRDPAFLAAVFNATHDRLTQAQAHISTLGRLDSRERVLLFLAEKAARAASVPVTLHMSREDIADYLGLNAETVSRILSKVKKDGLVRFLSPTEFVIPDMAKIARRLPVPVPGVEQEFAA